MQVRWAGVVNWPASGVRRCVGMQMQTREADDGDGWGDGGMGGWMETR